MTSVEFVCLNQDDNGIIFMCLIDKGFSQPTAFECLERIRGDFKRFFTEDQVRKSKEYELNEEFRGTLKRTFVSRKNSKNFFLDFLSIFNPKKQDYAGKGQDRTDIAMEQMSTMNEELIYTFESILKRDEKLNDVMDKSNKMNDLSVDLKGKVKNLDFLNKNKNS